MIDFQDLKLEEKSKFIEVSFKDTLIPVRQYVTIDTKMSIINIAVQESIDTNGMIVRPIAEALLSLYIVFVYTDIAFADEVKADALRTYDILENNGVIDLVVAAIPVAEYDSLIQAFNDVIEDYAKYRTSAAMAIESIFTNLPNMIETMNNGLSDFDLEKFEVLNDVVKTMGGNEDAINETLLGQK